MDHGGKSRPASSRHGSGANLGTRIDWMDQHGRTKPRVEVVNDLREVVRRHGFKVVLAGGVYELQGVLARLVAKSLVIGRCLLPGICGLRRR